MKFIPDDINIDFMGARKKAFILSGVLVLISLLALITMGLNQGIDFKGGSAVIVAFRADQAADRDKLQAAVQDLVTKELGLSDTYVSVQDFDVGVASETEGQPSHRYLVYTEVTSLVSTERRKTLLDALTAKFGETLRVESPAEGADVFYLTYEEEAPVPARYAEITALFTAQGFSNIAVSSDVQKQLEVQWLEGLDLVQEEAKVAPEGQTEFAESQEAFEKRLKLQLVDKMEKRFTVNVEELKGKVNAKLAGTFGEAFIATESATSVSPSVGRDLLANGLLAILYAFIGILIYITLRFDFRYAPGAVVALVHDVTITLGIFAILQVKFTLPIIAALLTIVGYSLNDTIVVLDRVRETFESFRGRSLEDLLNRAINSTLSRTVLTSLTTFLVVIMIFIFGGGLIRDFALALLIGIIVGTYSSIFVASPLVYYMDQYITRRDAAARATSGQQAKA